MSKLHVPWESVKRLCQSLLYEKQEPCVLCGQEAGPICPACVEVYFHPEGGRCQTCGKLVSREERLCRDCREGRGPKGLDKVTAWGHYSGSWRDFIQTVKFKAQPFLLKAIARPFADWAIRNLPPPDALVPVPMHPERLAERGYNQASVLASALNWELGIPLVEGLVRKTMTTPQVGLNRRDRLHNLTDAFAVSVTGEQWGMKGRCLWLIDDVVTTGATLEACAQALRTQGVKNVYGLALAAGSQVSSPGGTVREGQLQSEPSPD